MNTLLPDMELLRRSFSDASFSRAEAYQRDGRVIGWEQQPGADLPTFTARVRGSGGRIYEVYVQVGFGDVEGDCTCPVGYNCKHVAATLLQIDADDAAPPAPKKPSQDWLKDLVEVAHGETPSRAEKDPKETYPPRIRQRLIYGLVIDHGNVSIELRAAHIRDNGSFGTNGTPFAPHRAWDPYLPRFVLPSDQKLLRALVPDPRALAPRTEQLPLPADAAPLLRAILATGRCRLDGPMGPALSEAPTRKTTARWELLDDGNQVLRLDCEPEAYVLRLTPPWYLDPTTHTCGPLDLGIPDAVAGRLLSAPRLSPKQAAEVARVMERELGNLPIPRPQVLKVKKLRAQRPIPQLHFFGLQVDRYGTIPAAQFRFRYGDASFLWTDETDTYTGADGVLRKARRDSALEQALMERLTDYPLAPAGAFEDLPVNRQDRGALVVTNPDQEEQAWLDLQTELPQHEEEGWEFSYGPGFGLRPIVPDAWYGDITEGDGRQWFDLELGVEVEGQRISLLPVVLEQVQFLGKDAWGRLLDEQQGERTIPIPVTGVGYVHLPVQRLRAILTTLVDLFDPDLRLRNERLCLPRARTPALQELEQGWELQGDRAPLQLAEQLRDFTGIKTVEVPKGFNAELRPYQHDGLNWLQFLREYQLGGILADDMGLGKTIQTLAHLLLEKRSGRMDRPALVVAPTSLMFNWRHEAARFAPDLRVLLLHGPQRRRHFDAIDDHDLVLTTYPLLPRDMQELESHEFHQVILDEAQAIKNPRTKASQAVRQLNARHRLCLTGTPMENHLGELWSVFDFLNPGLLGSERQFRRLFRTPIEKDDDLQRRQALSRRIKPFFLRRSKADVLPDLPPKTEILRTVALEGPQRDLYETIRLAMHDKVRGALEKQGLERSHIVILDALLKLRQVCCDPRLLNNAPKAKTPSAKLHLLMDMVPEMVEEGRRILLFSQFTTMLGLIEDELQRAGIDYVKLTGRTRDRETPVQRFQAGEVPVFLISLKAGGTGLNLTNADTVIHYDPWWNPAVEDQATDRAHRIGQADKVFVYRLVAEGTVEEAIQEMQHSKRGLVDALFGASGPRGLKAEDLQALFEPLS